MIKRYIFIALGLLCVGLGALGVVTPGLPTTPFLLLASWLFYRSSPRLQAWLLASRLGNRIRDYERQHGMTPKAKAMAIGCMVVMCTISSVFFIPVLWARIVVPIAGLIGSLVVGFWVPTVHRDKPSDTDTLKTIALLLLCCGSLSANNDSKVYQGFSGGMMLHTGYLFGHEVNAPISTDGLSYSPQGATFGIGGGAHVNLGQLMRVGCEGFVSTMNARTTDCRQLLRAGSYVRTGWGGLSVDACWRKTKVWPFVGTAFGGGAMRSLYLLEGSQDDWMPEQNATFHKQSFFYVGPYAGLDWCMTTKVHLSFRLDWLVALNEHAVLNPTGPRLYFGFMFCH